MRNAILARVPFSKELIFPLGWVGGRENVEFLVELAKTNPTTEVRIALTYTKKKEEWSIMHELLDHKDIAIASAAMSGLSRGGDPEVKEALKKWLTSGNEQKRKCAVYNSILGPDPGLVPALLEADSHIKGNDRKSLYRALAHCGNGKYLDELHVMVQDESEYERWRNERPPDPAMAHINWNYTQNHALDAIAKLGSTRSLPVLDKLAKEAKDPKIRQKAARTALAIRSKKK